ncbi:MAG: DUF1353 domain-containing protein [Desulfobacterales bacterium]|nr:DUF1353 domain-containing protein [Desulfobacterales bacterium]
MKARFLTQLNLENIDDNLWKLISPLRYRSALLNKIVEVPAGFETDLASVPRVPIAYWFWGGRVHREAVLHDYLYRIDSTPVVSFSVANRVFLEAANARKKAILIRYPMFWGVVLGGYFSYHKKKVRT